MFPIYISLFSLLLQMSRETSVEKVLVNIIWMDHRSISHQQRIEYVHLKWFETPAVYFYILSAKKELSKLLWNLPYLKIFSPRYLLKRPSIIEPSYMCAPRLELDHRDLQCHSIQLKKGTKLTQGYI